VSNKPALRPPTAPSYEDWILSPAIAKKADRCKSKAGTGKTPRSSHKASPIDPLLFHDTFQTDPVLAAVVDAWLELPEAIKAGILTMVRAAKGVGGRQ
jgi:hypothetical protein